MVTKRQLGLGLAIVGAAIAIGLLAGNLLGLSQFKGVGPVEQLALRLAFCLILVGASLFPLGSRPA